MTRLLAHTALCGALLASAACFDFTRERFGRDGEPCFFEGDCERGFICAANALCVKACGPGSCSGHGACTFDDASAAERCACDVGYQNVDSTCVGTSVFRVVHAATRVEPIDIYITGEPEPVVTNLAYGQVGRIASRGPGVYRFDIRPAGAIATSTPSAQSTGLSVLADVSYTVVLHGDVQPTDGRPLFAIRTYAISDEPRFIHAADLDSLSLTVGGANVNVLEPLQDAGISGATMGNGFELKLRDTLTRTAITTFDVSADASRAAATFVLIGDPRADATRALQLLVLGDPSDTASLRTRVAERAFLYVLNAIPDASWLSLAIGSTLQLTPGSSAATQLTFNDVSVAQQPLVVGRPVLSASPMSGASIVTVVTGSGDYAAGDTYALIATGFVEPADNAPGLTLLEVPLIVGATDTARFVHAAPDAAALDISVTLESPLTLNGFTFGAVSDPFAIATGHIAGVLGLDANRDNVLEGTRNFSWTASSAKTYLLVIDGLSDLGSARALNVLPLVVLPNGKLLEGEMPK